MGDIFGTIIPEAAEHMTYRTYRQQVISGNIANVDTPGYRSREALFEKELESRLKLTATDPGHLGKSPGQPLYRTVDDPFSRIGNDANTVDIDREMMKLSQNQLLYSASAEIITRKLDELRNVIGGIR
ncbi:MAG TPA: flagellar basal body rod protein FlgB [Deltaproteobacteria bacterium]|jgi:flagellar basal-body rod protein FlgB|nr:flagellar basal body rod protein FlgB [Deltaproteobacteria bacterium]HRW80942.1 flagellar basal body rod protein FlgB [Desulfomonilia bacterium]HNQ84985.1 flagellar basal body rod protein FlgB [Deltaproteobacteria bacterium]HNS88681.1 flagellar basal body rod protein FlgB [Deltaproteobacteria bacterium]HOA43533.1 flagellar basal body rod protein FlgB [Deltaproteobacteria bacterium]